MQGRHPNPFQPTFRIIRCSTHGVPYSFHISAVKREPVPVWRSRLVPVGPLLKCPVLAGTAKSCNDSGGTGGFVVHDFGKFQICDAVYASTLGFPSVFPEPIRYPFRRRLIRHS